MICDDKKLMVLGSTPVLSVSDQTFELFLFIHINLQNRLGFAANLGVSLAIFFNNRKFTFFTNTVRSVLCPTFINTISTKLCVITKEFVLL